MTVIEIMKKQNIVALLIAIPVLVFAQSNQKVDLSPVTDFMRNNQAQKPTVTPFAKISGNWIATGSISSTPQDEKYKSYAYSWRGRIIGAINTEGKFRFRGDNGCELTGAAIPFASDNMWSTEAEVNGCPLRHMNQRMIGRIIAEGKTLTFRSEDPPFAMGRTIAYEFKGTFGRF